MALAGLPAQLNGTRWDALVLAGRSVQTTQIYEGTNQIQRMVISKKLGL
jgi:alkylation response protein AidB-like acyl-CoA dehydrogenase